MKKGQKRQQERALKKRAKRNLALRRAQETRLPSESHHIRAGRGYPIEGCWTQQDWDQHGLAVIVIARRQPDESLTFGTYLVDYYCLGLKNTFCNANIPSGEFYRDYLPRIFHDNSPIQISPALAHELIYGGIGYAAQFGFKPHRDFRLSQYILDPPDLYPGSGMVEFGKDGKPFFVAGPHDNVQAIMRQLARTAGEGNFDYLAFVG